MLKNILVLVSLLGLTACDPFEGVLSVKQPMNVKSTEKQPGCSPDNSFGCDQIVNVTVPVGDVGAKLEFSGKTQIQINLKINGKKRTLTLDLPKKLNVPDNGTFVVSAQDLGQDFAAQGNAQTVRTDSQVYRGWDSCTYQRQEQVCYPAPNGGVTCHIEWRNVNGQQQVEYFNRDTKQDISVNFVSAQNSLISNFSGNRASSERIYTYRGQCF
ncbi:MAG: hypothetical protein ABL930_05970 [Pseudobdellovibrio sp.]